MSYCTVATYPGRGIIWNRIKGLGNEPKNIGWGSGSPTVPTVTGSASYNVNMFGPAPETRTVGASSILTTTQLGDTYQVTGTIVALAARSITEAGLFDFQTSNSPVTTLAASLTAAATSIALGAAVGPASVNFYAQVENETVLVTAGQGTSTVTFTRGMLGSSATSHSSTVPFTVGGDGSSGVAPGWTTGQTATQVAATYGGNMFLHADFGQISLNSNDSVSFTFTDTLT